MSIDRGSDRAAYRQLADLIRDRIRSGQWRPGARVPSEPRLVTEFGIGRETVRRAMALLRAEALVTSTQGDGTRVRDAAPEVPVRLAPGDVARVRMPTEPEFRGLGLEQDVPVFEIRRATGEREVRPVDRVTLTC